jgi:exonuclease SbcD
MRILHTSDWHLGRTLGPVSFLADQQAFMDWMLGQVAERSIDLVVIAGDIFDRPVAPNNALVLFRTVLRELQSRKVQVAVITGNHDGPDRVANYHDLLDASGVYLRGGYTQIGEVIALEFADGPLDLVPLPFLDPQMAPDRDDDDEAPGDAGAGGRHRKCWHLQH